MTGVAGWAFIGRRVGAALLTMLLAITIAFGLARLSGDPVRQILGPSAAPEQVVAKRAELGLDRSIPEQYVAYMGDLVTGDLGRSLQYNSSNVDLILSRLMWSLELTAAGTLLGVLIGFPLGLLGALKRESVWDRASVVVSMVGQSVPPFWLGLMLVLIFAVNLGWLPAGQGGDLTHLILPAIALSAIPLAQVARLTRSTALDVLAQDYVVAARARGFSERRVIVRHVIRGTALPIVTLMGLLAGALLSGAVTVEYVFGWPGLGSLIANAVQFRDFTLIQALVVFGAAVFVVINLLVDVVYGVIDPRVRVE